MRHNCGMNKQLRGRVTAIALGTRAWVQERAERTRYNASDLEGWCAIASAELHKRLTAAGIDADIHMWVSEWHECHCFCVVDDHVVDVTATQFKQFRTQELVIMHYKEAEAFEMYNSTRTFGCAADLRRFQKKEHWPSNQIAFA